MQIVKFTEESKGFNQQQGWQKSIEGQHRNISEEKALGNINKGIPPKDGEQFEEIDNVDEGNEEKNLKNVSGVVCFAGDYVKKRFCHYFS